MLTDHQLSPVTFNGGHYHEHIWRYQSVKQDWKFHFYASAFRRRRHYVFGLSVRPYHFKSLHIISRHYKKSLLRSQIYHGDEELSTDTNYPIWRRQKLPYMKKTRKKKQVCSAACFMAAEIKFSEDVRPSVRPKPEIPSFDLYMGPLIHPTNRNRFTACPSVRLSVRPSVRPSVRRGFRAFAGECMEGLVWNFTCWCILTIFRTD